MKNEETSRALTAALARLLAPLVRILLRYGVTYGTFTRIAKHVYVRVALEEFRLPQRKQSASRVALLTGLPRKEVTRVLGTEGRELPISGEEHSRVARLISGWRHDRRFLNARGQPASLPMDGAGSFSDLVRRYGADVPARATLDELQRMGAVETLANGRVRLLAESYVPADLEVDKFGILGADVADLVSAIDHNLVHRRDDSYFQRKVAYDNLSSEAAARLRARTNADADRLVKRVDARFAKEDRDISHSRGGSGRKRVVLGIWYYEEDFQDTGVEDDGSSEE